MTTQIKWNNTTAPNFSAANQLITSGNSQLSNALKSLANIPTNIANQRKADAQTKLKNAIAKASLDNQTQNLAIGKANLGYAAENAQRKATLFDQNQQSITDKTAGTSYANNQPTPTSLDLLNAALTKVNGSDLSAPQQNIATTSLRDNFKANQNLQDNQLKLDTAEQNIAGNKFINTVPLTAGTTDIKEMLKNQQLDRTNFNKGNFTTATKNQMTALHNKQRTGLYDNNVSTITADSTLSELEGKQQILEQSRALGMNGKATKDALKLYSDNYTGSEKVDPKYTNAENTAYMYGDRLINSRLGMERLEKQNDFNMSTYTADGGLTTERLKDIVLRDKDLFASDEANQYMTDARSWTNAVLRKESGAVISDSEFINAWKTYFPVLGNSPETVAKKAQKRLEVEKTFIDTAGNGRIFRGLQIGNTPPQRQVNQTGSTDAPASNNLDLITF